MMFSKSSSASAAVQEATKPRKSGVSQNAYTVRSRKEPEPHYVKMKVVMVSGRLTGEPEKEAPLDG